MNSYSFATYQMTLHSKEIVFQSEWSPNPPGNTVEITIGTLHSPPLDLVGSDIPGSQSSFYVYDDPSSAILQNLIGAEQEITISGTINFTSYQQIQYVGSFLSPVLTIGKGYFYYLDVLDENYSLVDSILIASETSVSTSVPVPVSFTFSETVTVPSLYYVRLRHDMNNIDFPDDNPPMIEDGYPIYVFLDLDYVYETTTQIDAIVASTVPESQCNVFAIHEALAIVAQSITNDPDPIRSNYFGRKNSEPVAYNSNGCGSFRAITNGLQIRQFPLTSTDPKKNKPHSVSMKELYFGLDPIDNLGMGVEKIGDSNKIRIEPKDHFYDNTVIFRLSNLDIKMTVATEYYYNNITIGYSTWENEEINGIDEFNSKRQFTLGLKTIGETDEILSNLVASGYAIEFTRRKKYLDNSTEDYKYDNNTFIICLNRSTDGSGNPTGLTIAEKDENYADIEDLISPQTAY